jgi:hypothetical protein
MLLQIEAVEGRKRNVDNEHAWRVWRRQFHALRLISDSLSMRPLCHCDLPGRKYEASALHSILTNRAVHRWRRLIERRTMSHSAPIGPSGAGAAGRPAQPPQPARGESGRRRPKGLRGADGCLKKRHGLQALVSPARSVLGWLASVGGNRRDGHANPVFNGRPAAVRPCSILV